MNTTANSTASSHQATFGTSTKTRFAGFGMAAIMTLAILLGVDGLAQIDNQGAHAQIAEASAPVAAASAQI